MQMISVKAVLILLLSWSCLADSKVRLQFDLPNGATRSFSLGELKQKLTVHQVSLHDPHYGKAMVYSGFALTELLDLGFANEWLQPKYSDMTFTALDGFKAVTPLSQLRHAGGFVVFADLNHGSWQPVGNKKANPGPFYLVWKKENQSTHNGYPWPWQLASFTLVRFDSRYPKVFPQGVAENTAIYRGFKLFKQRCFSCHAMSQQGGKVGPDLNAPQNILAYRSEKMVKAFIRDPGQFRYSKMPAHLDLSEQQLSALIAYLRFQGKK